MLKGAEEKGHDINKIYISRENISPLVLAVIIVALKGECIIKDDMVKIYDYIDNSDIFILASPPIF